MPPPVCLTLGSNQTPWPGYMHAAMSEGACSEESNSKSAIFPYIDSALIRKWVAKFLNILSIYANLGGGGTRTYL